MDTIKEMIKLIQQYIITVTNMGILPEINIISYTNTGNEYIGIFNSKMDLVDTFYHIHYNIYSKEYTITVYNKIDEIEVKTRRV